MLTMIDNRLIRSFSVKKISTFFLLFFVGSVIYAQKTVSVEYSIGGVFNYSKILSQTDNLNFIESLPVKSISHGIYFTSVRNKFDFIIGVEYNRNGIKASTNLKEQRKLYSFPNLASAETTFYYSNWSFPILVRYNFKHNNSVFSLHSGFGYTYSRNGNINPRCFYGSGTINDTIPFVSGSIFCVNHFNKISQHNLFFRSGIGYNYHIKKIGQIGLRLDFNLGLNLIEEAHYDVTFLNGDNYQTLIGNKGHQIRLSLIYKWTK